MTHRRFACLIPAHNEVSRLPGVLRAVLRHPMLDEVIVIDDGSTDGTGDLARTMGARVIRSEVNRGKTHALTLGIEATTASHLVLIDADLQGLTPRDITRLILPVAGSEAMASLSLRGNAPALWRLIGVDYITGERVIPRALVADQTHRLRALARFGFEVFLNRHLIAADQPIAVVHWPGVTSPAKVAKRGLWHGLRADLAMLGDIFATITPWMALQQVTRLRRHAYRPGGRHAARATEDPILHARRGPWP